uniref:Coatomer subunit epsilon n=1 Tax=Arcella intermedia TaxID=1963864 RepID=A0A6B2LCE3_9EUKA
MFELETSFLIGNYQATLNIGHAFKASSSSDAITRDWYIYRAYVHTDPSVVLNEIGRDAPLGLISVKLLAAYCQSSDNWEGVLGTIKAWLDKGEIIGNPLAEVVIATILYKAGRFEDALRVLSDTKSLEGRSLLVQLYLSMHRFDYAAKEVKQMQAIKDDAVATQLATAWLCLHDKGKYEEAAYIYQDIIEKYGSTVSLLNGLGVAYMSIGQFDKAEKILLDALVQDNKSDLTKTNLVVVSHHLDKPYDKIKRDLASIMSTSPSNPWTLNLKKADENFDLLAKKFRT